MTTTEQLAALKDAAEKLAAFDDGNGVGLIIPAISAFSDVAGPQAVLDLIADNERLRDVVDTFANAANAMDGMDDEKVLRLVYDDPQWGDNTVLVEWFVRPFRKARAALNPDGGA